MNVKLALSITATSQTQLERQVKIGSSLTRHLHLDVMDGRFVRTRSCPPRTAATLPRGYQYDLHAMVDRIDPWFMVIDQLQPRRVFIHVENGYSLPIMIAGLRSRRQTVGLAINPGTPLKKLWPWLRIVKDIMIMGVNPGHYQAPFQHAAIRRIRQLRLSYPSHHLICDGGMHPGTIPLAIKAGLNEIVIGSEVMLSPDPPLAWQSVQRLCKTL